MTWDFRTIQGSEGIAEFLDSCSDASRISSTSFCDCPSYKIPQFASCGKAKAIQAFLNIDTINGRGEGLVRLVPGSNKTDI